MIRVHFFSSFLAVGVCFALLGPGWTSQPDSGWDSRESQSDLLDSQTSASTSRAVYRRTAPTLSRWRVPTTSRAVGEFRSVSGRPIGAVLSLVSIRSVSSVLTTCEGGPDDDQPPIFVSVLSQNISNSACSSVLVAAANNGECSVSYSPNKNPMLNPSCSTTGVMAYCSAGPNGSMNGAPGPSSCSVTNGSLTGTRINCSAMNVGESVNCSTQGNANGPAASTCSVYAIAQNASCSTGSNANGQSSWPGFCSAQAGQLGNNQQQNNFCSVSIDSGGDKGQGNVCSTDGDVNQTCSVSIPNGLQQPTSTDTCSVTSANFGNAACSVINTVNPPPPAGSANQCSVTGGNGQNTQCSVFNGNVFVHGPVNGVCGTLK